MLDNVAPKRGRELRVLRLLQKAINDPEVDRWSWRYKEIQQHLETFMYAIVKLRDDYKEIQEIRRTAIQVANSLGRIGFDYLRPHYDRLTGKNDTRGEERK